MKFYYFLLGMAAQAILTAGMDLLGMIKMNSGQQFMAGVLFLVLALILRKRG